MSVERFVPEDLRALYAVHDWRNGLAVLSAACPDEWADVLTVLRAFRLRHTEIATPGGRKSLIADRLDGAFKRLDWKEKRFDTRIIVDGVDHASPTHEVDVFKGRVALEAAGGGRRITRGRRGGIARVGRSRYSPDRAGLGAAA